MKKKLLLVLGMVSSLIYFSDATQESFILPKKKSEPAVSYEQLCELLGDVMYTCTRLQHCVANLCDQALNNTRDILTRNKTNLFVSVSKQDRTKRAQRIHKFLIRVKSLEAELDILCKELLSAKKPL